MGANDLQQSLLEAMNLLSNKAANSTNAAVTIKGEIVEELDSGTHQYSISYGGAIYKDAYSTANMTYLPSTIVYLLVPDGDFDNPKIILSAAASTASVFATENETDSYIPISEELIGTNYSRSMQSWLDKNYPTIFLSGNFKTLFSNYLSTYRNFVFSAYVKTNIDKDHQTSGNYGLILNLPFIKTNTSNTSQKEEIIKSYIMDVSTMQGNPYAFNEYQKVNLYYKIDDTLTFDTSKTPTIIPFTKDFGYTTDRTDVTADIFIKDISIQMIDVLSEEDMSGYYLTIVSNSGNYFPSSNPNNKVLTPLLKVNGKTTTKYEDYQCYWYIEDSSITTTSEDYTVIGGLGWKCINKKNNITYDSDGRKIFQYETNNYNLTVTPNDVISTLKYKCILTKDDFIVGGTIKLKNLKSDIITSLYSKTGMNTYVENVGEVSLIARIKYPGVTNVTNPDKTITLEWQRFDKDGNYLSEFPFTVKRNNVVVDGAYETEISFPASNIEKLNTINCTFYQTYVKTIDEVDTVVKENIATETISITTTSNINYLVNITEGDKLYKYDSDGDSPKVASYDGPRTSAIQTLPLLSFRVFKANGTELTETEYKYCNYKWLFPKFNVSMLKLESPSPSSLKTEGDYYVISGIGVNNIKYDIAEKFNKKKNINNILLSVSIDGNTIETSTSMKFVKDGESGTNGSKYSALITYKTYPYGERDGKNRIRKCQALFWPNNKGQQSGSGTWHLYDIENRTVINFNNPTFGVEVYKDGSKITSGYSVYWDMLDSSTTDPCFNINSSTGQLTVRDGYNVWPANTTTNNWDLNVDTIYCNIIRAAVTINAGSDTNSEEVIYIYYPIEITRLEEKYKAGEIVPSLDGGFEEVTYASDGTNPQWDNANPFNCVNPEYIKSATDFNYKWICSSNLNKKNTEEATNAISPTTKFDNCILKNYVGVKFTLSTAKYKEFENLIKEKKNEITNISNNIVNVEKYKNDVLTFLEYIKYSVLKEKLDLCSEYLKYKYNLIDNIKLLLSKLEEIEEYANTIGYDKTSLKIENKKSTLKNTYNQVYRLGYESSVNNLKSLSIKFGQEEISSYHSYKLETLAKDWNSLIDKYNNLLKDFKDFNQLDIENTQIAPRGSKETQEKYLRILNSYIISIYNNTALNELNNLGIKDFINFRRQVNVYIKNIYTTKGDLISYSAYDKIFKEMNQILDYYFKNNSKDFKDECNQKIDGYQTEINELNQEINELTALLVSNRVIHIKPIIMNTNTYEMSTINGWNGTKMYIDETNNQYLYAPQIGAGLKANDSGKASPIGKFTGIIMGVSNFNQSFNQKIGLFGFGKGTQSLFLNSKDGSAIFGKTGGGQIIIDPRNNADGNDALLYNSGYFGAEYDSDGKPTNAGYKLAGNTTTGKGTRSGMLINLTAPYIHFFDANKGKIYSGACSEWKSGQLGFHLSHKGLTIGNGFMVQASGTAEVIGNGSNIGQWRIREATVTKEDGATEKVQCITSKDNAEGIYLDAPHSTIVLGSSTGRIYSGQHYNLGSKNDGFYLSNNGLSIGTEFIISTKGLATIEHEGSSLGKWRVVTETDSQGNKKAIGFKCSADNGILMDAASSQIVLGSSAGKIYSGGHTSLTDRDPGFYLSNNGMSIHNGFRITVGDNNNAILEIGRLRSGSSSKHWTISGDSNNESYIKYGNSGANNSVYIATDKITLGKKFYVDKTGELRVGKGAASNDSTRHWVIDGGTNNSHITYNTNADSVGLDWNAGTISGDDDEVYIGTDGIRLGTNFAVNENGQVVAKSIKLTGELYIGKWKLEDGKIVGVDSGGQIIMDAEGAIYAKNGSDTTWSIHRNGNASFKNITCENVFSFGSGNNTWSSSGGFSFGDGSLGGNTVNTNSLDFTKGTVGLGNASGLNHNGISYDGTTCKIAGDIYANNCYLKGQISAAGVTFDNGSGGYIKMNDDNNHPKISGINVGSGGIKMNGTDGISNCANIGNGGAVWTFATAPQISTSCNVRVNAKIHGDSGEFASLTTFKVGGESLQYWFAQKANKGKYYTQTDTSGTYIEI